MTNRRRQHFPRWLASSGRTFSFVVVGLSCVAGVGGCRKRRAVETTSTPLSAKTTVTRGDASPSSRAASSAAPSAAASATFEPLASSADAPARHPLGPLHFLAIGGGATPESTEVSLEQDIALVEQTLPGPGAVLFAGGSGSESVRELDPNAGGDTVLLELGDLFNPRQGRRSRYRPSRFASERATVDGVEARLGEALSQGDGPLLVYVAAHGDQGTTPRDNSIALWGGQSLTVKDVAEIHERHKRPLRLVATSCFSGGFAELAFQHADEHAGPSRVARCGLFAGTWDRETSGCDANPDRRAQESYGLHFIHALGKTDKVGRPLPLEALDYDHDGKVGLLDAHTRARIASVSFDVPTTTSERWLRSVEHGKAPIDRKILPEDLAVVDQLGKALGLPDEAAVERKWKAVEHQLDELNDVLDDAEDDLDGRTASLTSALLERWPMLDDAYNPDFGGTFAKNRDVIAQILESSDDATAHREAEGAVDAADARVAEAEVVEARVLRLRRAYETLHKASALLHRGGSAADYYRALLECERAPP
jgi:hypothetical protein